MSVANVYESETLGSSITAPSTPNDGISRNILIGTRGNDLLTGESGSNLTNEMLGQRGDDYIYGGSGPNTNNVYAGGAGIDTAIIPAASNTVLLYIDYQAGIHMQRQDGGFDSVNSETEIVQFSNGHRLLPISAGSDDRTQETNWIPWRSGDALAIASDWLSALSSGQISISSYDVNLDGVIDTALVGVSGVNTYVLLGYNQFAHPSYIAGTFGQGVLLELA